MQFFQELISFVLPKKLRKVKILGTRGDLLDTFFKGIVEEKWGDLNEARADLFGEDEKSRRRFWRLQKALDSDLIRSVFLMNQDNASRTQRDYFNAWLFYSTGQVLRGVGLRYSSTILTERALRLAQTHQFLDLIVLCAKKLKYHYGAIVGDRKQYRTYCELFERYNEMMDISDRVEGYYLDIAFEFAQSKSINEELLEKSKKRIPEVKAYIRQYDNYWIHMLGFNIFGLVKQMESDYRGLLEVCQQAIEHFGSGSVKRGPLFNFTYKQIPCFLQLEMYSEARQAIHTCLGLTLEGTYNWIITLEYQVMYGFHSGDFQAAYEAIKLIRRHLDKMDPATREQCLILDAYVHFFIGTGDIIPTQPEVFRPARFMNEVPIFSKDKAGHHINILILQILHSLLKRRTQPTLAENEITTRRSALEMYVSRHLRGEYLKWARLFLRMLIQIPAGYFNPVNVRMKAAKDAELLKNAEQQWANQRSKLEPAPYAVLWDRALMLLEEQRMPE